MNDEAPEELDIPDGVDEAEHAVEVLRAWVADGRLHVALAPEAFRHDVSEWGRLLAEIAHHVANAVSLDGQMEHHDAMQAIDVAFDRRRLHGRSDTTQTRSGKLKGSTKH